MKIPTVVVLSMSLAGDWLCAASKPVRVPLDVSIDGVYQATNAVVEMPFETIGMPLSAWKPLAKDSTAIAFVRLLAGISSGQYQEVEPFYTHESRKDKPGVADGSVVIEHIPVRQFVELYRTTFSPINSVRVVGRVPLGSDYLYLWIGTTARGPLLRGFRSHLEVGKIRFSEVSSASPLESFLVNAAGRVAEERWSRDLGPVGISIPISTAYSIYLRVNGPAAKQEETVRTLFDQFRASALAGRFEQFQGLMTQVSFERMSKWIGSVPEGQRNGFRLFLGEERRILKEAPMGSLSLVFWVSSKVAKPGMEDLQYSYIDLKGGGPHVANIFFQGIFDDVLRRNTDVAKWAGIQEDPSHH